MRMRAASMRVAAACPVCGREAPPFQALAPHLCPNCGYRYAVKPPEAAKVTIEIARELPAPKPMLLLAAPEPNQFRTIPQPIQNRSTTIPEPPEAPAPPKTKSKRKRPAYKPSSGKETGNWRGIPAGPSHVVTFAEWIEAELIDDYNCMLNDESRFQQACIQAAGRRFERLLARVAPEEPPSAWRLPVYSIGSACNPDGSSRDLGPDMRPRDRETRHLRKYKSLSRRRA